MALFGIQHKPSDLIFWSWMQCILFSFMMLRRAVWYIGADILEKPSKWQSASQEGLPAVDYVNCSWPKFTEDCNLAMIGDQLGCVISLQYDVFWTFLQRTQKGFPAAQSHFELPNPEFEAALPTFCLQTTCHPLWSARHGTSIEFALCHSGHKQLATSRTDSVTKWLPSHAVSTIQWSEA